MLNEPADDSESSDRSERSASLLTGGGDSSEQSGLPSVTPQDREAIERVKKQT